MGKMKKPFTAKELFLMWGVVPIVIERCVENDFLFNKPPGIDTLCPILILHHHTICLKHFTKFIIIDTIFTDANIRNTVQTVD